jgi:CNT family concentrative nucleoside transporter
MRLQGVLGIIVFLTIACCISEKEKASGPGRFLRVSSSSSLSLRSCSMSVLPKSLLLLNNVVLALDSATRAGTSFVFGMWAGASSVHDAGPGANFILAFQSLPLVLVIGAISSLLFYWRILPYVVRGLSDPAKVMNIGARWDWRLRDRVFGNG